MLRKSRAKKNARAVQVPEGVQQSLAQGAGAGATRIAEAVETAGARVAKGSAVDRASDLTGQIRSRVGSAQIEVPAPKVDIRKLRARMPKRLRRSSDAVLKSQLAKTSRELAHESSELGDAVNSLNAITKANRRAGARGRTRLISGLALGAGLMYHLDAEHGQERRAATARRLNSIIRGQRQ